MRAGLFSHSIGQARHQQRSHQKVKPRLQAGRNPSTRSRHDRIALSNRPHSLNVPKRTTRREMLRCRLWTPLRRRRGQIVPSWVLRGRVSRSKYRMSHRMVAAQPLIRRRTIRRMQRAPTPHEGRAPTAPTLQASCSRRRHPAQVRCSAPAHRDRPTRLRDHLLPRRITQRTRITILTRPCRLFPAAS
jgi:hypothetical protein